MLHDHPRLLAGPRRPDRRAVRPLHRRSRLAARHLRPDGRHGAVRLDQPVRHMSASRPSRSQLLRWITVGSFEVDWALRVDSLSTVMMLVVGFISFLIHVYSVGYMSHDTQHPALHELSVAVHLRHADAGDLRQSPPAVLRLGGRRPRLLSADRLLVHASPSACAAAIKAFIVNRVGDFGLVLGIAATFLVFDSVQYDVIFANAARVRRRPRSCVSAATSARSRSDRLAAVHRRDGQVGAARPAHLAARRDGGPDPGLGADPRRDHGDRRRLPGRALLAALRVSRRPRWPWSPSSAPRPRFFAATIGLTQFDIKRVIAYSTCSQLGYMFFACGVGAYSRRHLPPVHPRLLQGAAVPRRRLGDPCHVRRAGHAQDGRHLAARSRSPTP